MVPNSGIPDKVDAKAFLWIEKELHVVYSILEECQARVKLMAFAAGGFGVTLGLLIGFILWYYN